MIEKSENKRLYVEKKQQNNVEPIINLKFKKMDFAKVIKERFKCKIIKAYDLSQTNEGEVKDVQIKFVFDNGNCVRSKLTQTFDNEYCGAKMTIFVPNKFINDVVKWCETNGLTSIPRELYTYYIEL